MNGTSDFSNVPDQEREESKEVSGQRDGGSDGAGLLVVW